MLSPVADLRRVRMSASNQAAFPWGGIAPFAWYPVSKLPASDGATIDPWIDFSGQGRNMAALAGGATYVTTGGPSSLPNLFFSAASYRPPDLSALTAGSLFIVFRNTVAGNGGGIYNLNTSDDTYLPFAGDAKVYDGFGTDTRHDAIDPMGGFTDAWHIYDVRALNGSWTCTLDGNQLFTTGTNTFQGAAMGQIGFTTTATFYAGRMADLVIFESITVAQHNAVRTALRSIYGI